MKTKSLLTLLLPLLFVVFNAAGQSSSIDGTFTAGTSGTVDMSLRTMVSGTATARVTILSGGNVGIGFSSPSQKLSVSGNIQASGAMYAQNGQIGTNGPTDVSLRTNSTERLLILNSNGNVGIATASGSITEKFVVTGNILSTGNFLTNTGMLTVNHASNNFTLRLNSTDRVTVLNTNGYMGIGTASPSEQLHVSGNVLSTGNFLTNTGLFTVNHASNNYTLRLNSTDRLTVLNASGNVGVGTASPSEKLHVSGNILSTGNFLTNTGLLTVNHASNDFTLRLNSTDRFTILNSSGNVGIGTTSPAERLSLSGGDFLFDDSTPILYTGTGGSELNRFLVLRNSSATSSTSGLKAGGVLVADDATYASPGKNDLIVKGKVFIGQNTTTNSNSYDLGVKGKIGAKDLQLETSSWADYVFADNYKLPSLLEVERYIREHKHLEGVPAEEEVLKDGYSVSEMDNVLLKKVEELTLYIIEQQKQIDELKTKIDRKRKK